MKKASARRTLRIGIASVEAMKARSMAIARGEVKPASDEPKIWFPSAESLGKVLSNKNRGSRRGFATRARSLFRSFRTDRARGVEPFAHAQDHGAYGLVALKRGPRGRSGRKCPTRRSTCASRFASPRSSGRAFASPACSTASARTPMRHAGDLRRW